MRQGWTLKSHRYLDGTKVYRLHALSDEEVALPASAVHGLQRRGYMQSNQKFPAATLLLTDRGRSAAESLAPTEMASPLTARNFDER